MSRPYIKINSMAYSDSVLSMDYTYYKLRSATPNTRTLTVTGFSSSLSFTTSHDNVDYSSGRVSETLTFSVTNLGTSSTTTYTPSSISYVFGGTPSTTSNVTFTLQGATLSSATSSSATLATFLSSIVNGFSYGSTNANFTASVSGNTIIFTAPAYSGTIFNNIAISAKGGLGGAAGATLTYSVSGQGTTYSNGTFSGGVNTNRAILSYDDLGYTSTISFNTTGTNL